MMIASWPVVAAAFVVFVLLLIATIRFRITPETSARWFAYSVRVGLVVVTILSGIVAVLLVANMSTLTVTTIEEIPEFLHMMGF